jgi:hypothetical protein
MKGGNIKSVYNSLISQGLIEPILYNWNTYNKVTNCLWKKNVQYG